MSSKRPSCLALSSHRRCWSYQLDDREAATGELQCRLWDFQSADWQVVEQ